MRRSMFPGRAFGLFMARWVEQYALRKRYHGAPFLYEVILSGFEAAWAGLPGQQLYPVRPETVRWEYVPRLQAAPLEKPAPPSGVVRVHEDDVPSWEDLWARFHDLPGRRP